MKHVLLLLYFTISLNIWAQSADESKLIELSIKPRITDNQIIDFKEHNAYFNPTATSRNTLLLHFGGSFGKPSNTKLFPKLAANNGIQAIVLSYKNNVAARTACGNSIDNKCYDNYREEVFFGNAVSDAVTVNKAHSVVNRLLKLLIYLHKEYPLQGWNNYYNNNEIIWSKIITSGHSQGGGLAAYSGLKYKLNRVLMFASPNDFNDKLNKPANWLSLTTKTEKKKYYGLINTLDDIVPYTKQISNWKALKLSGDTVNINNLSYPFNNANQLMISKNISGVGAKHSVMILDSRTPIVNKKPLYELVWRYMLGLPKTSILSNIKTLNLALHLYPNPSAGDVYVKLLKHNIPLNLLIYNSLGQQIFSTNINQNIKIPKKIFPSQGVYFIKTLNRQTQQILSYNKIIIH